MHSCISPQTFTLGDHNAPQLLKPSFYDNSNRSVLIQRDPVFSHVIRESQLVLYKAYDVHGNLQICEIDVIIEGAREVI